MNSLAYIDTPCDRCGSKKRVSRTWKETIPTFTGTTEVEFSQIVCVNDVCQKAFDEDMKKEAKKREELRMEKEEKMKARKANIVLRKGESPKSKSRI